MTFKHSHMIISTNFELEPLLASYASTYPNIGFADYNIVFKSENERPNTPYTYIVVFTPVAQRQHGTTFQEYVEAWCKVNRKKAAASVMDNVFPELEPSGTHPYRILGL